VKYADDLVLLAKEDKVLQSIEIARCYGMEMNVKHGAETWTLRKVNQKYLESSEMWCWRRMEKISWSDRVRNEVLRRVKEESCIVHTIKRRKVSWIGHILRRNCLLKQ
jgi:hypothetical protein